MSRAVHFVYGMGFCLVPYWDLINHGKAEKREVISEETNTLGYVVGRVVFPRRASRAAAFS